MNRKRAAGIVYVAVLFTAFSSILIRLSNAPPLAIAAWRMIFATVMLLPFSRRNGHARIRVKTLALLTLSGVFLALHFATWITSLSYTSVVHSTVLVTTHPLIVLLGSAIFLGTRLKVPRLVATGVAIVGAVILAGGDAIGGREPTIVGDVLAFAGAVAVAAYLMIGSYVRRTVSAGRYNAIVHIVAAIVLIAFAATFDQRLAPYAPREFALFAALAFFCTILGHSLMNWALRYVPAPDVSLAIILEPVFASIMALFLFGEIPGITTVAGAVIVLLALAYVSVGTRDRSGASSPPV